jgi:hypothetical protein
LRLRQLIRDFLRHLRADLLRVALPQRFDHRVASLVQPETTQSPSEPFAPMISITAVGTFFSSIVFVSGRAEIETVGDAVARQGRPVLHHRRAERGLGIFPETFDTDVNGRLSF